MDTSDATLMGTREEREHPCVSQNTFMRLTRERLGFIWTDLELTDAGRSKIVLSAKMLWIKRMLLIRAKIDGIENSLTSITESELRETLKRQLKN